MENTALLSVLVQTLPVCHTGRGLALMKPKSPAVLAMRYTPVTRKGSPAARILIFVWHCNPTVTVNYKPREVALNR